MSDSTLEVDRHLVEPVAAVALAVVLAAFVGRSLGHAVGIEVRFVPGLVLALALLAGPIVAWGAAIGVVVVDVVTGVLGPHSAVEFLLQFVLVAVGVRLWGSFGRLSSGEAPGAPSARNVLEFLVLSVTVALVVGTLDAWGAVLFDVAPFTSVVADSVFLSLVSMLAIGTPILYLGSRVLDRLGGVDRLGRIDRFDLALANRRPTTPSPTIRCLPVGYAVLLVALGWAVSGFVAGLLFQGAALYDQQILVNQLGSWITTVLYLSGPGGITVHILLGLVSVGAWLAILHRGRSSPE